MTASAPASPRRRSRTVHPVLFAVLPVFALYTGNLHDLVLRDLLLSAAPVALLSLPLWWLCARLTRDPHRGAVLASLLWVWFFAFGPWERWIAPTNPDTELAALVAYFTLPLTAWLLVSLHRSYVHVSGAFQWIALGLLLLQAFTIARYELGTYSRQPAPAPAGVPASNITVRTPVPPAQRPHIFFIVLDGYARADVLADTYHVDNRPFLQFLESRGFQVAARSRANYAQTLFSVPSCLDLNYLDAMVARMGPTAGDRRPLAGLLRTNRTRSFLHEQGYDFVAFPTGFDDTQFAEAAVHLTDRWGGLDDFQSALLENSALWPALRSRFVVRFDADHARARTVLYALDHLPLVARNPRPTFVFSHLICPHPPFVFRRDGTLITRVKYPGLNDGNRFAGSPEEYRSLYRDQVEFINGRVERMVDRLLQAARRPTVIVLLSDHGPSSGMNWQHPGQAGLRERFSTLLAVRLPPERTAKLDDSISIVNVMRFVLSQCLGADLPPLPTRSYFADYSHPYRFTWIAEGDGEFHPNPHVPGLPR